ncbi:heavy-metal-associated domain-containing protein [Roseateles sp.]|uniref:heavy-metal-associated domain-containing protein n=1 Tax=Roseateles sp. TaxID=1971397 RepID=UPI0025D85BE0|nr:heavy-metal-associated domain-containing protein [Roseateles sp.]MBV8037129.1 heavy-metal-associated domain-containing protein [Roseateles sp.]
MIAFEVNDMSCGHCVSTIAKALKAVDAGARVHIDLASHRVQIEPTEADADELADAIREAGYTPAVTACAPGPSAAGPTLTL